MPTRQLGSSKKISVQRGPPRWVVVGAAITTGTTGVRFADAAFLDFACWVLGKSKNIFSQIGGLMVVYYGTN